MPNFTGRFGKIFESHKRGSQWFASYEMLYSCAGGVIGGMIPASDSTCNRLIVATTAMSSLYFLMLVMFRPYASKFDSAVTFLNSILNLAGNIEALTGADDAVVSATNAAAQNLSAASVACLVLQEVLKVAAEHRVPRPIRWLRELLETRNDNKKRRSEEVADDQINYHKGSPHPSALGPPDFPFSNVTHRLTAGELNDVLLCLNAVLRRVVDHRPHHRDTQAEIYHRLEMLVGAAAISAASRRQCT